MSFSEIITGLTALQEKYLALQEHISGLESEIIEKTDQLDLINLKNQNLVKEIRSLRSENKKLRQRPTGVRVEIEETHRSNSNHSRPVSTPSDNIPPSTDFGFHELPPELAAQLAAFFRKK